MRWSRQIQLALSLTLTVLLPLAATACGSGGSASAPPCKSGIRGNRSSSFIAFDTADTSPLHSQIYIIRADGSGLCQVTSKSSSLNGDSEPSWSPDRKKLAIVSDRGKVSDEIDTVNPDGTGRRRLVGGTHAFHVMPAWSPDGKWIAFASGAIRGDTATSIYVIGRDGHGPRRVTRAIQGQDKLGDKNPTWSPDGKAIAFSSDRQGQEVADVYVVNVDGTGLRRLTHDGVQGSEPAWSPDGRKIAFGTDTIELMNADGSARHDLTHAPDAADSSPTWSPGGNQIAFASTTLSGESDYHIFVINSDGTGRSRVKGIVGESNDPSWQRQPPERQSTVTLPAI